jgi:lysophospholipase L1-like esterase
VLGLRHGMPASRFEKPSVTTLAAAVVLGLAVGFVRCGAPAKTGGSETPGVPSTGATRPDAPGQTAATPEVSVTASASAAPPRPSAPAKRQKYVVAALGDSLTDAKSGGGKYLEYVAKRCPESRFDNFGKGGDMVNQMRKRFERDVLNNGTDYTHLVVFGGVNDLYSDLTAGRTPAKVGADLTAIYSAARAKNWSIVALTVAPWGGFAKYYNEKRSASTRELNGWLATQVKEKKIDHVVDAFALLSCGDPERLCPEYAKPMHDGLHFGPPGHEKLGAALYEQVFASCR